MSYTVDQNRAAGRQTEIDNGHACSSQNRKMHWHSWRPVFESTREMSFLEADIAADYNIASEHSTCIHVVVDGVGYNTSPHGELDWGSVDDAYDVARSRSLEDSEELAIATVLGVKLDHLLVVVGSLKKLNPSVERAAICGEQHLNTVNAWVEWECAKSSALDNCRLGQCLR